ncbi:MAG: PAS domain S-box protein, partial [Candidatus Brocadiaceae bacterium]|nr:PAS domain S-box protein [Candidatus Brocadiaceae bacterium]
MNSHEEEIKILNRTIGKLSRQLKMLEERYRAITETVVDAIISIDVEDRIIICNPATKKIFGYEDEIIGINITTLMPERYRNAHKNGMKRYLNTGIPKIIGSTVEVVGVKKDGNEFPIELSLSAWRTEERHYFTGIIRDITERKQMEHNLIEANKKLEELS